MIESHATTGKRVAIIGAGPAGLSAAWFLRRAGHAVTLFEALGEAGGRLRECPPDALPPAVLAREIANLLAVGIDFRPGVRIGQDLPFATVRAEFDAVVVAAGAMDAPAAANFAELEVAGAVLAADRHTGATATSGVFAAGNARRDTGRMAVRAIGSAHDAAIAADQFLRGQPVVGPPRLFHSRMGMVEPGEMADLLKEASPGGRVNPAANNSGKAPEGGAQSLRPSTAAEDRRPPPTGSGETFPAGSDSTATTTPDGGFTSAEAAREAARCLRCDCRKPHDCKLRDYAAEYGASPRQFAAEVRPPFSRDLSHPDLVYEPGKCVRCGLCVRISRARDERIGLAFLNRGSDLRIAPPCGEALAAALAVAARECVAACPTGALAWRRPEPPPAGAAHAGEDVDPVAPPARLDQP